MSTFEEYAKTRGWHTVTEHLPDDNGELIELRYMTKTTADDYAWWTSIPVTDPPQSEWEFIVDFAEHGLKRDKTRT